MVDHRKISLKKEGWDAPLSPQKETPKYIYVKNLAYMERRGENMPHSSLPTFYGKSNEDPNTFLFEFDILCRGYNYLQDAHKLKLFPATLKDSALGWFMGLGKSTIKTLDDMKTSFL